MHVTIIKLTLKDTMTSLTEYKVKLNSNANNKIIIEQNLEKLVVENCDILL